MYKPGSILLVSCYELGHQPLALASPLGFLERAGYSPDVLDVSVEGLDNEKVLQATFIGISVPMHTALRLAIQVAESIRQINPAAHICFYGLYASLNAEYLLENVADSIIGGEFETPLVALVEAVATAEFNNETDEFLEVEGVSFRSRMTGPFLERLSFEPPIFRGLPPLTKYAKLLSHGLERLAGYVEASRGCLHRCRHCPITPVYDGRFFVVPEAVVMESIRNLVQSGATHITFGDPDFLNGPGHSIRIVRAMHREFPNLTFDFTAKVEHLLRHRFLIHEFAEAGCLFVVSAFESLSDVVLEKLNKGHCRDDIDALLKLFQEVEVALRPTWVPFTPWTTLDDYIEFLEYVCSEGLISSIDPVQYTIRLLVPPGSALLQGSQMSNFLGPLDQVNFSHSWDHPDERMDRLQEKVYSAVEEMTRAKNTVIDIFQRVRDLAYEARGEKAVPLLADVFWQTDGPRLTESWFC